MIEKFILYAVVLVSVGVGLAIVNKKTKEAVLPNLDGVVNLRMNRLYYYGGIFMVIIWAVLIPYIIESGLPIVNIVAAVLLISMFTLGLGLPVFFWYINHNVSYDDKTLRVQNVFKKQTEIQFNKILSKHANYFTGFLIVKTEEKEVKIHLHLVGVNALLKRMEDY